jgi:hypothetical protein
MTIQVYVNSAAKRTETIALVDCGATENFIDTNHAYAMRLPLKRLAKPREVFNIDKTPNHQGPITHYTDLVVRTGSQTKKMRFFLTHLGGNPIILGYPWFTAMEPHITWSKGWINYDQLPIVLYAPPEEDSSTCVGTPMSEGAQTRVGTPISELRRV